MYKGTGGTVVSNTPVPQTPTMSEQKRKPFIVAGAVVRPVEAAGHRFALSRRPVNSMKFRAGADKYPDSDPDSASPAVTIRTNIPTGCVIDVEFPANLVPGDSTNYFFTLFKHNLSGDQKEDEDEETDELDCSEARVVVPKDLRDGILFVHHYSRLACHASWLDMMDQIQEAGYTWRGLGHSCKQMTGRCMECMQAKRAHSKLGGLHSSRRYTRPFDTLSWDLQDLGKASETTFGKNRYLLTVLCEFTSFPELYSLPDKTAEAIADCLVDYCLRWGKPSCIWSGHDAEIKNEVVAALEAPLRRRPRAAGITPQEQSGRGAPKRAALTVAIKPGSPRCLARSSLGTNAFMSPATVNPMSNQGADSINRPTKCCIKDMYCYLFWTLKAPNMVQSVAGSSPPQQALLSVCNDCLTFFISVRR